MLVYDKYYKPLELLDCESHFKMLFHFVAALKTKCTLILVYPFRWLEVVTDVLRGLV